MKAIIYVEDAPDGGVTIRLDYAPLHRDGLPHSLAQQIAGGMVTDALTSMGMTLEQAKQYAKAGQH